MEQAFDFCKLWRPKLDPLTIIKDKYNGTYSDALYTAWNLEPCQIPIEIFSDENTCREMWLDINTAGIPIGRSSTDIKDAEIDLQRNLSELHEHGLYDDWWGKAVKTYLTWDEIMSFLMGEEYHPTHFWDK